MVEFDLLSYPESAGKGRFSTIRDMIAEGIVRPVRDTIMLTQKGVEKIYHHGEILRPH
jgi:hypothetical protein